MIRILYSDPEYFPEGTLYRKAGWWFVAGRNLIIEIPDSPVGDPAYDNFYGPYPSQRVAFEEREELIKESQPDEENMTWEDYQELIVALNTWELEDATECRPQGLKDQTR